MSGFATGIPFISGLYMEKHEQMKEVRSKSNTEQGKGRERKRERKRDEEKESEGHRGREIERDRGVSGLSGTFPDI